MYAYLLACTNHLLNQWVVFQRDCVHYCLVSACGGVLPDWCEKERPWASWNRSMHGDCKLPEHSLWQTWWKWSVMHERDLSLFCGKDSTHDLSVNISSCLSSCSRWQTDIAHRFGATNQQCAAHSDSPHGDQTSACTYMYIHVHVMYSWLLPFLHVLALPLAPLSPLLPHTRPPSCFPTACFSPSHTHTFTLFSLSPGLTSVCRDDASENWGPSSSLS